LFILKFVQPGEDSDEERAPEDTDDGEIDSLDEDDMDFQVARITSPLSKRQRTPAAKKLVNKVCFMVVQRGDFDSAGTGHLDS
jgi:hypothetical protein